MKKLLIMLLFSIVGLTLNAPNRDTPPKWKPVSFEIVDADNNQLAIVTKHGIYCYNYLPPAFLVYERKRNFGYEILLKQFETNRKKWH
jgi:hypothetical protein